MNSIPAGIKIFGVACDKQSVIYPCSCPNDSVRQPKAMLAAQLDGSFCNCHIEWNDIEVRL